MNKIVEKNSPDVNDDPIGAYPFPSTWHSDRRRLLLLLLLRNHRTAVHCQHQRIMLHTVTTVIVISVDTQRRLLARSLLRARTTTSGMIVTRRQNTVVLSHRLLMTLTLVRAAEAAVSRRRFVGSYRVASTNHRTTTDITDTDNRRARRRRNRGSDLLIIEIVSLPALVVHGLLLTVLKRDTVTAGCRRTVRDATVVAEESYVTGVRSRDDSIRRRSVIRLAAYPRRVHVAVLESRLIRVGAGYHEVVAETVRRRISALGRSLVLARRHHGRHRRRGAGRVPQIGLSIQHRVVFVVLVVADHPEGRRSLGLAAIRAAIDRRRRRCRRRRRRHRHRRLERRFQTATADRGGGDVSYVDSAAATVGAVYGGFGGKGRRSRLRRRHLRRLQDVGVLRRLLLMLLRLRLITDRDSGSSGRGDILTHRRGVRQVLPRHVH